MAGWRKATCMGALSGILLGVLLAQKPFREYPSVEYGGHFPLPARLAAAR